MVLDDRNVPASKLASYDIVICSDDFLQGQYDTAAKSEDFYKLQETFGLTEDEASKFIPRPTERPNLPLHSSNIDVLIVDDIHQYGSEESPLRTAVRSLRFEHSLLITGVPQLGGWRANLRQMEMLPNGGPFVSEAHFMQLFTGQQQHSEEPTPGGFKLLKILVDGMTVARTDNFALRPVIYRTIFYRA